MPFRADTVGKLKRKIVEGVYSIPDHVSTPLKHLITHVIRLQPSHRYTMVQIIGCEWLQGRFLLQSYLIYAFSISTGIFDLSFFRN